MADTSNIIKIGYIPYMPPDQIWMRRFYGDAWSIGEGSYMTHDEIRDYLDGFSFSHGVTFMYLAYDLIYRNYIGRPFIYDFQEPRYLDNE